MNKKTASIQFNIAPYNPVCLMVRKIGQLNSLELQNLLQNNNLINHNTVRDGKFYKIYCSQINVISLFH